MSVDEQPTLKSDQQSILDQILAKKLEHAVTVTRTYEGVEVEFKFQPVMNITALRVVAQVQKLSKMKDQDVLAQLEALTEFIDSMAFPDTANMIAAMITTGAMTMNDLADVQQAVVEAVAARPTTRSSSSDTASVPDGDSSTDSAPQEESIPAT